jgi:hypothetical protein
MNLKIIGYIGLKILSGHLPQGIYNKELTRTKNNSKRQKGRLTILKIYNTHICI